MTQVLGSSCCVCGARDARSLEDVFLTGGVRATLCGSHAIMHRRARADVRTTAELRTVLRDRRDRSDRRQDGDELGASLAAAFSGGRREVDRRRG